MAILLAGASASAITVSSGPLVGVSAAGSPVPADAACLEGQAGYLYRQSEAEPSLAVDPSAPGGLLASWQQDRWNNGAAQETVLASSSDGGATWNRTTVPYQICLGGEYRRVSDPWVSVSPDGAMYQMALVYNLAFVKPAARTTGMAVSRSTDRGATWSEPVVLDSEPNPTRGEAALHSFLHDKNSITADPYDSRFVYAVWDNAAATTGKQRTMFARSTDGGATWEPARMIYDPAVDFGTSGAYTQSHILQVLAGGGLVDMMIRFWPKKNGRPASLTYANADTNFDVAVIRSPDRGRTWSGRATRIATFLDALVFEPASGGFVRCGDNIPSFAENPANGWLYVAWQDTDADGGTSRVKLSVSRDGGRTWSAPIVASRTPNDRHAFTPVLAVNANGLVGLFYYDFRNFDAGTALSTDAWLAAYSDDGSALTFLAEERLTDATFDVRQAPYAGGYFLGDYEGLAASGDDFLALFVTTLGVPASFAPSPANPGVFVSDVNQTGVFLRRVTVAP